MAGMYKDSMARATSCLPVSGWPPTYDASNGAGSPRNQHGQPLVALRLLVRYAYWLSLLRDLHSVLVVSDNVAQGYSRWARPAKQQVLYVVALLPSGTAEAIKVLG